MFPQSDIFSCGDLKMKESTTLLSLTIGRREGRWRRGKKKKKKKKKKKEEAKVEG